MTMPESTLPSQEERILAALAHASMLLPLMGLIGPILIWVTQKEKSAFVSFQALQAVAYQLLLMLAGFVGMACYMTSFFGLMFGAMWLENSQTPASPVFGGLFLLPFLVFGGLFLFGGAAMLYALWAALQAFQGKAFRYPWIAARVDRFLQNDSAA